MQSAEAGTPTPTAALQSVAHRAEPMVWLSAGAVVTALMLLLALLSLLAGRGVTHFWPRPLMLITSDDRAAPSLLGVVIDREPVASGPAARLLVHRGADEFFDSPLVWVLEEKAVAREFPPEALAVLRADQGPLFGFLEAIVLEEGVESLVDATAHEQLSRLRAVSAAQGSAAASPASRLAGPRYQLRLASGQLVDLAVSDISDVYAPNSMSVMEKSGVFFRALGRFLSDAPRRSNLQGGVFPAIVGTVTLVLADDRGGGAAGRTGGHLPAGICAARVVTGLVRIAVNNLAGVPSIVYGVFGLGFFVYAIGGSLDQLLFAERLPAPTLGTPGMLWAALTMALLTLPVVIVSTEEGLARVPTALREGSLALGATRAETLWRVVLPAASPAVLTGLILAIARATGEVAPLILVGVAKYAPGLPVSTEPPFLHLDRQFMHLGFYIYDLGFQSPHLQTVEGLVFATALLLVVIVLLLNIAAVLLRSRLRDAFKAEETL
jgi:phosphate transport system permease protein